MRPNLITRLKEEWNNLDPIDPLRGLIADAIDALAEQPAQQREPVAWRELCRRLYVELYWCDRQMMETLDQDGEPMWTQGKEVRDVLADAKAALDASPQPSKPLTLTDEQIETAFKAWHYKHGNNTQGIKWVDDLLRSCWKAAIEAAHAKGEA